jgi:hypothetical protein
MVAPLLEELYQLTRSPVFAEPLETFSLLTLYHVTTGAMRNMLAFRVVLPETIPRGYGRFLRPLWAGPEIAPSTRPSARAIA